MGTAMKGEDPARGLRAPLRAFGAAFLLSLLLAAGAAGAPGGDGGKAEKKAPPVRFSGVFAFRFEYDANVIHYSDEDLDEFTSVLNTGKFSITQAGDWIARPRIDLNFETKALTGGKLEAQLRMTSWRYVENTVKNNDSYQVRLKHPGFGSDNFQLTVYHAPMAYIRNFRDRAPYLSTAIPLAYADFSYTSTSVTLAYWRRLRADLDGSLDVKRSWRYFNQAFMENDTWEWRFGGSLGYRIAPSLKLTGEYAYITAEGRGADEVGETVASSDNSDPSYDRDSYIVTLAWSSKKGLFGVDGVSLAGEYQAHFFTSEKSLVDDPMHVGRKDEVNRIELGFTTLPVAGDATLEGGYRYVRRTSSAPAVAAGEDIGEEKDYTDFRTWFGFVIPF
jgi:hypothetical protein